jgi:hypothetical protein
MGDRNALIHFLTIDRFLRQTAQILGDQAPHKGTSSMND